MTDPLEAALLPCPFCGSSPEMGEDEDGLCAVMCLNKNCYVTGPGREEASNAVSSWNRRALLAREQAVAEAQVEVERLPLPYLPPLGPDARPERLRRHEGPLLRAAAGQACRPARHSPRGCASHGDVPRRRPEVPGVEGTMTRNANPLAARLRKIARQNGLKQTDIAKRAGVSCTYVSDLLNGRRNIPPMALEKLCNAIDVADRTRAEMHVMGARLQGWNV